MKPEPRKERTMRAFLAACVAAIILAACGLLALGAVQKASGVAFSTSAVRIDPDWSWRQMFRPTAGAAAHFGPQGCEKTSAYRWMFVDLGETNEPDTCAVSQ
jgi:hypothetical protein